MGSGLVSPIWDGPPTKEHLAPAKEGDEGPSREMHESVQIG